MEFVGAVRAKRNNKLGANKAHKLKMMFGLLMLWSDKNPHGPLTDSFINNKLPDYFLSVFP